MLRARSSPSARTTPHTPSRLGGRRESLDERRPLERARAGDHRGRVLAEPLLEQRGVDRAEVARRAQVAVVVEVATPGNSPTIWPFERVPIKNALPAAPWSVPSLPFS